MHKMSINKKKTNKRAMNKKAKHKKKSHNEPIVIEFNLSKAVIVFIIIGVLIGSVIAIIRNYHENTKRLNVLNFLGGLYVNVIRGTPVILQLMIIYYVIFKTSDINILIVGIIFLRSRTK